MAAATQLLNAERSTLFLYDAAKDELWSQVAEGTGQKEIRISARAGIAGARFVDLNSANHILLSGEPAFADFLREVRAFISGAGRN